MSGADAKTCRWCGEAKPLEDFHRNPKNKDGRFGHCKSCASQAQRADRAKNPQKYSESEKKRRKTEHRKRYAAELHKKLDPVKLRARWTTQNAIRSGKIKPLPCEKCGSFKVQAHHDDYSKPLEVRWLCYKHHQELHGHRVFVENPAKSGPLPRQSKQQELQ